MKEVKLTDEEKTAVLGIKNLTIQLENIYLERNERVAIFWKKFKAGGRMGNYKIGAKVEKVFELTDEEQRKLETSSLKK